jgi:hypothetical protein
MSMLTPLRAARVRSCGKFQPNTGKNACATSKVARWHRHSCLCCLEIFSQRSNRLLHLVPLAFLLGLSLAQAAIWPDQLGPAKRLSAKPVTLTDQKLWSEYGLEEAEQAEYDSVPEKFTATAYRLQDSTAALGVFDWQRPKNAKQSQLGQLAAESPEETILAHGNYVLVFRKHKPQVAELEVLFQSLPKLDQSPLPALRGYLPSEGLVPNSERYVTGPVGLENFHPGIPAGVAAFHLGSEAQIGAFGAVGREMKLAIFNYPTPNIARERMAEMQKLPSAIVKRTGPLVAVILSPPSADDAERLLSLVRYQATISWDQHVPTRRDNIGDLIINAFILIGVLLVFSTVAGLAFGGFRSILRRSRKDDPEAMTVLRLGDR